MESNQNSKCSYSNEANNKSICPYCQSEKINKRGFFKRKQRYGCKACGHRFIERDAFFHMRNNPKKITMCIDMYYRGISLRKIQEHLQAFTEHNSSHQAILNWIRKYCLLIGNFTDKLEIKTSTQLTFDEMEYRTKGKDSFFFDVMDMETRYIVASDYFYSRSEKELLSVLKQAAKKATTAPTDIHTDGLMVYPEVIRKAYYSKRLKQPIIQHITKSTSGKFNWKIERLHENIRERTKIIRQFKSLSSAKAIMKGWEIFYNFCRKHQGIDKYPYELATDLKLGENKWLELIKLGHITIK